MSLLIRKCRFDKYWRYIKSMQQTKIHELYVSSLTNLRISRNFCNACISMNILDGRIRKCLDYLMDEYNSENYWKNSFFQFIDLNTFSDMFNKRTQLVENIQNLQDLAKLDMDIKKLAKEEEALYKDELDKLDEKLLDMILSHTCKEHDSIIIEITAGVGGQEAMLFVKDLYEMYIGYAKYLGLNHEIIDIDITDNNGIRNVSIILSGKQAFKFRHEGGVHRVQRVPTTEKSGRVHTSTASVAVLPAPSEVEVKINEKDLKIETKRASGAGGQHVNTTDSAIRIIHMPTGLVVNCQKQRSQIKNKQMALMKLRSILYEQQLNKQTSFMSDLRRKQMGMGLRNEKIRTYNYNQDRVTDHRLQNGILLNLDEFMRGGAALEELENRLYKDMQMKILLEIVKKLEVQRK